MRQFRHNPTSADKRARLATAIANTRPQRLLAMTPADLRYTGAAPKEIEYALTIAQQKERARS